MDKLKFITVICVCLLLSACNSVKSDAKKLVLSRLKDPDSAKFGNFTQVNEESACFTVNARNSMGGYTGDQQAILTKYNSEWMLVAIVGEDTNLRPYTVTISQNNKLVYVDIPNLNNQEDCIRAVKSFYPK